MSRSPALPSTGRLPALDGLRGVAAFVVLLYHLSLIARPFVDSGRIGDAWWWLTETPAKVLTVGTESVLVFFALSGLVVALPALRDGFSWRSFYASMLVRLYVPVWAALALAAALITVFPREPGAVSAGQWISNANAGAVSVPEILSEASLWRATYVVDNVLWSLRWELIFSLALPLFVGAALALRRFAVPAVILATVLTVTGRLVGSDALVYLPVFFLGTIMAVHLPRIRSWSARQRPVLWSLLLCLGLLLLILSFLLRFAAPAGSPASALLWGFAGVGAPLLLFVAIGSPAVSRALSTAVPQKLGRISFSLYLVHVPVLATVAYLVGDERWWLVAVISIPLCLTVGWLFYLVAERPSHALARRLGRLFGKRPARAPAPSGA